MTKIREALLDRMIRIYGFEHQLVIQFAESCEYYTTPETREMWDHCLEALVECHEKNPWFGNDSDPEI